MSKDPLPVFRKMNTFDAFSEMCKDFQDKNILDFGGNRGNLIESSDGKILPKNYTCMDLSQEALDVVKETFPESRTIHWNRYDHMYNKEGDKNLKFPHSVFGPIYDIGFANSVFTHHTEEGMMYCLKELSKICKEIYFTYVDPTNDNFFDILTNKYNVWFLDEKQLADIKQNKISYVVDGARVETELEEPYRYIWTVIDTLYLIELVSDMANLIEVKVGRVENGFDWMKLKFNLNREIAGTIGY
jgi:hypothetical protein